MRRNGSAGAATLVKRGVSLGIAALGIAAHSLSKRQACFRVANEARHPKCPIPGCEPTFSLAVIFIALTALGAAAAEPKRVLIVHSFGSVAPPFTTHSTAFEAELVNKMGNRVDLDEVSLDMARYAAPDMQEALVEYLEKRGAKWKPDLVVPIGGPAGVFVAQYRRRLFPEIPILYCSLDQRLLGPDAFDKNTTFVGANYEVAGFVEDILQIAPDTKNIAVVIGATPLEQYWTQAFRKGFEPFTNRVNFIWLNDLSFDQMLERVGKLPPKSYIFLILLLRDAAGVTQNADEALQRLHAVANAPINSIFTSQMGLGIVGGRLYPSTEDGIQAAETAVRILNGEPPSRFPPRIVPPLSPRYDWRELQRWRISEQRLPPGSTVLFRAPTAWEQHRGWIIAGVSIFVVQALLISGLLANLIKRWRAERSLTESEQRFRTMADAAPVMIWMSGEDKLCAFFNKAWLEFTGRTMDQELGNGWADGVYAEDLERCLNTYTSAFGSRKPFVMQYRLRRHDGEYRWITDHGVPRYGPHANFRGYIGACLDITDFLEKEQALREVEQRIALAAEAAQLGAWELDATTNRLWLSDKVRDLFQIDGDGRIDYTTFQASIHPDDRTRHDSAVKRAIETKGGYEIEYRILRRDGTVRWIAGRARCVPDKDGSLTRLLGVSADITGRKRAEEEARRRREQIDLLMRASLLGEMTASLAHELNQPLSAIISNANAGMRFIGRGDVDPAKLAELLEDVAADGRRAHEIIRNVRNTIKGSPNRQPIDLNEVVTNVVHMVRPDAAAHSCEVETSLASGLPLVEADPTQMQQLLINLVNNAFDAMLEMPSDRRKVHILTQSNDGDTVRVTVRDQGMGVPKEAEERLFEHFFTTKKDGLGMGLAIARSIVESHGGNIDTKNDETGGARFSFTLPIKRA